MRCCALCQRSEMLACDTTACGTESEFAIQIGHLSVGAVQDSAFLHLATISNKTVVYHAHPKGIGLVAAAFASASASAGGTQILDTEARRLVWLARRLVHDGELAHRIPGSWVDLPAWRTLPLACIQSSVVYQTLHASLWVWCVTRHGALGAL